MRTRRPRVGRSKGRAPQARKPPRRLRPSKPRRKPEKPRGSETSSSARIRAGCWATSETPSQDARDTRAYSTLGRSHSELSSSGLCMTSGSLNFAELRQREVHRSSLPGTSVNKGKTNHSLTLERPLVGNKEERRTGILEGGRPAFCTLACLFPHMEPG